MRLLPPSNIPQSAITISVNLPAEPNAFSERLILLFEQTGAAAVWGVDDPLGDVADQIRASNARHEIALRVSANSDWRPFVRSHLEEAERTDRAISTVIASDAVSDEQGERLARHGISMIARLVTAEYSRDVVTRRFGLWEVAANIQLPVLQKASEWRIRRGIDHALSDGQLLHVAIDGAAADTSATLSDLHRILDYVALRQRERPVAIQTMSEIAAHFRQPASQPARSILRVSTALPHAA
jgi:hypothetical protein